MTAVIGLVAIGLATSGCALFDALGDSTTTTDGGPNDSAADNLKFAPKVEISTGKLLPVSAATGDFNSDGKPDIVVSGGFGNLLVFSNLTATGAATPSFTPPGPVEIVGEPAGSVSVSDLNADGLLDLAAPAPSEVSVSVFLNTTPNGVLEPTFAPKVGFPIAMASQLVVVGDLDRDDRPDLVAPATNVGTSVLLNNTPPGNAPMFDANMVVATTNLYCLVIGDLNGDLAPDFVAAKLEADHVSVSLNLTAADAPAVTFGSEVDFDAGPIIRCVALADVNADGKPDLVTPNRNPTNTLVVRINTTEAGASPPTFGPVTAFPTNREPTSVAFGDVTGDGLADLAVSNTGTNDISVLANTTTTGALAPSFAPAVNLPTGDAPNQLLMTDINGDGKLDLVTADTDSKTVSILLAL